MSGSRVDMKIVLLGKEYGGKTSLLERYLYDHFNGESVPYQATIGAAYGSKKVLVPDGRTMALGIWDTAGSERYESMSRIYYRGARAAIVCYDLTEKLSFERAQFWITELRKNEEKCRIYLCGTKHDIVAENKSMRQVDYHTTTDLADEIGGEVFETSSKTGTNIGELFQKIATDFANDPSSRPVDDDDDSSFQIDEKHNKSKCCSS